ncbi:MAG: hydrogenase maturation nickel metallochaperone HypA [Thermodesulfobacteriota bacterium]
MHEMSLVQGLLGQLQTLASEHNKTKIIKVTMEIGPFSGVVIDSFQFGFDILAREDSLTRDAELIIKCPPASYRCCGCTMVVEGKERPEACPRCSETLFAPDGSNDLILASVEME